MSDGLVGLVHRLNAELIGNRNLAVIETAFDPAFVSHTSGDDLDRDGFRAMLALLLDALPDVAVEVPLVLADDDLVAWRSVTTGTHSKEWLGLPATGRKVSWTALHIARVRDGVVVEHWGSPDMLGLLGQLEPGGP